MSAPDKIKTEYTIALAFGILFELIGIYILIFRPTIGIRGALTLGGNYAILGILFIIAGLAIIKRTSQVFRPIFSPKSVRICPHCGATVKGNTNVCKKCKQLF